MPPTQKNTVPWRYFVPCPFSETEDNRKSFCWNGLRFCYQESCNFSHHPSKLAEIANGEEKSRMITRDAAIEAILTVPLYQLWVIKYEVHPYFEMLREKPLSSIVRQFIRPLETLGSEKGSPNETQSSEELSGEAHSAHLTKRTQSVLRSCLLTATALSHTMSLVWCFRPRMCSLCNRQARERRHWLGLEQPILCSCNRDAWCRQKHNNEAPR